MTGTAGSATKWCVHGEAGRHCRASRGSPAAGGYWGPDLHRIGHCAGGWAHEVQVDDFEPETGYPLHEPGQGGLIGQLGAKSRRARTDGNRAVVELRP